ncbi:hypothetical protein GYMLUDRAFT_775579 [Collybiopsis luxurians FD-317 M1]|uniref:Unplaced genomic scaffold GYMLUscaffold_46, whole genome shotgun sequence n=1 Tax=Collybiopsis luxurians FD-317 M1 TaxID=944289 RepID=A0A0D0B1B0_9AGAR|nr:hypothetical protein GYMLUDRAFT_775579 [Collybiopsis luxurians FD-317 M1]
MPAIPDNELTKYHDRIKGKTVVVTGGGAGIGRATAKLFAFYGARVVVAGVRLSNVEQTVREIQELKSGEAVACKCDVTKWEDLVAMFDLAIETFGSVDVVVASAGIARIETGMIYLGTGLPAKPATDILDINLIGVLYTVHLAQHYLQLNQTSQMAENRVKSIILLGSIYSWSANILAPLYTATKHAMLGLMRSLDEPLSQKGISITSVDPFYSATNLLPSLSYLILAGLPLVPLPRIAKTILYATSHGTPENPRGGESFWVPGGCTPTFMIPRGEFKPGVYHLIDTKSNSTSPGISGAQYYFRLFSDLKPWLWRSLAVASVGIFISWLCLSAISARSSLWRVSRT